MCHAPVYCDFHLQAAVVCSHHLVAETGGHHQIGLGVTIGQQPTGSEFTAEFFVVSEMQFHRAFGRLGHGL